MMKENKYSPVRYLLSTVRHIGFVGSAVLLFNFIFYRLKYIEKNRESECGYYLVKRSWAWILFSPLFLPAFMAFKALAAIYEYVVFIKSHWQAWINTDKERLTLPEKINYRTRLWD